MRPFAILICALLLALCGCDMRADSAVHKATPTPALFEVPNTPAPAPAYETQSADDASPQGTHTEGSPVSDAELLRIVSKGAVLVADSKNALVAGEHTQLAQFPYIEGGVTFVPLHPLLVPLSASAAHSGKTWYISAKGNVTIAMSAYNIVLFNTDPTVMDAPPVERDNTLFLQADTLATALGTSFSHSAAWGVLVYGSTRTLDESELERLATMLEAEQKSTECPELSRIAASHSLCEGEVFDAARSGRLYITDGKGDIGSVKLNDEFKLVKTSIPLDFEYEKDAVFMAEGKELYMVEGENRTFVSALPEAVANEELRAQSERFAFLKASKNAAEYADSDTAWLELASRSRTGDFLVCAAFASNAKYGYFTHSALITAVDADTSSLSVLHARSAEYGVGTGGDMDRVNIEALANNAYWSGEDVLFLCTVPALSDYDAQRLARLAVDEFEDYRFGYGGFLGLKETNCAELVRDSYRLVDVDLGGQTGESRLKEVLSGTAKSIVILPDDLLASPLVEVKAVWRR